MARPSYSAGWTLEATTPVASARLAYAGATTEFEEAHG